MVNKLNPNADVLNPPYGEQTERWLAKLAKHGNGIALVYARTETKMFFDSVWNCTFRDYLTVGPARPTVDSTHLSAQGDYR